MIRCLRTTFSARARPVAVRIASFCSPRSIRPSPSRRLSISPAEATIVRLAEHDGELLHWFYDEGLVPGTKLELQAAQPAAGQFTVKVDGSEKAIGEKAAAGLFVRPAA